MSKGMSMGREKCKDRVYNYGTSPNGYYSKCQMAITLSVAMQPFREYSDLPVCDNA